MQVTDAPVEEQPVFSGSAQLSSSLVDDGDWSDLFYTEDELKAHNVEQPKTYRNNIRNPPIRGYTVVWEPVDPAAHFRTVVLQNIPPKANIKLYCEQIIDPEMKYSILPIYVVQGFKYLDKGGQPTEYTSYVAYVVFEKATDAVSFYHENKKTVIGDQDVELTMVYLKTPTHPRFGLT